MEFWRFVTDFPKIDCTSPTLFAFNVDKLQSLFSPLYDGSWKDASGKPIRSTKLIYRSWNWMQGTTAIMNYNSEFGHLKACRNAIALGLLFDEDGNSAFIQLADPENPRDDLDTGQFLMGAPSGECPSIDGVGEDQENPLHLVYLSPFRLHRYCVSNREYALFDSRYLEGFASSKQPDSELHPVVTVNWYDAWCFSRWVGTLAGTHPRNSRSYSVTLPTEAQWEYGCRAGMYTQHTLFGHGETADSCPADCYFDHFIFPIAEDDADDLGNSERYGHCVRVDGKIAYLNLQPSPWGLYQMHGNVEEWCLDYYDKNYYRVGAALDTQGPTQGVSRVFRGGSWVSRSLDECRSSRRGYSVPEGSHNQEEKTLHADSGPVPYRVTVRNDYHIGFRLAAVVAETSSKVDT